MAIRSAGLTASLALAANAFMVPSTVSLPDVSLAGLDPALALHADSAKIVKLPCPGCSFAGADGKESADVDNSMVLTWSLGDDKKSLYLNGGQFYDGQIVTGSRSFPTSQVPSDTTVEDIRDHFGDVATAPRDLLYHVLERFTPAADGTDAQLIHIDFDVNGLGSEQVSGADTIRLRILKDEQGRLVISDVVQVPADNTKPAHDVEAEPKAEEEKTFSILPIGNTAPPTIPMEKQAKCEGRMRHACQLKAMLLHQAEMIRSAMQATGHRIRIIFIGRPQPHHGMHGGMHGGAHRRPCPGAQRHGPPGVSLKGGLPKFWRLGGGAAGVNQEQGQPQGPQHGHGQHGQHGQHRMRCHRFLNMLRRVFFGFIVPVLIGVAAGMTASLLGMVVGTLLAMFWIKCVRGGRRGNASLQFDAAREEGVVDELEKTGLMQDEQRDSEELPAYEDAPAYEDKEVRQ